MDMRTVLNLIVLAGLALFQVKDLPVCNKNLNGMTFESPDAGQLEKEPSLAAKQVPECGNANWNHEYLVICKDGKWRRVACK